jgi:hypothetical protein
MVPSGLSECGATNAPTSSSCVSLIEGAELRGLASRCGPQAREQANGLRPSTEVQSQDLTGAWVTVQG